MQLCYLGKISPFLFDGFGCYPCTLFITALINGNADLMMDLDAASSDDP